MTEGGAEKGRQMRAREGLEAAVGQRERDREDYPHDAGLDDEYDDEYDDEEYEELSPMEAGRAAARHITQLTGKDLSGVVSLDRSEDGWTIGVEVVEDRRIPSSSDILGTYLAEVDPDGELLSYRRTRRYARGRGDSSEVI